MPTLLYVVSPHGFGHAARTCAVIEALLGRLPGLRVDLVTTVPEWFFTDSLPDGVDLGYHRVECDVGLVQRSPFEEDVPATVERLEAIVGRDGSGVGRIERRLRGVSPTLVVADIAPLGLALATRFGVPGVLVENFTWGFIYRGYGPRLERWAGRLEAMAAGAALRIQAEPWCERVTGAVAVPPISRRPRSGRAAIRRRLGIADDRPLVLVSMGGVPWEPGRLDRLAAVTGAAVVVPGLDGAPSSGGGLLPLPRRSRFFHPDLVHAADLVVGKLGYSTVAEAWAAGVRFAYAPRDRFPESAVVAEWVDRELPSARLDRDELDSGSWTDRLGDLLALPRGPARDDGGAEAAAEAIVRLIR